MASTQRSTFSTLLILPLCLAVPLLDGYWNPIWFADCRTSLPLFSPLIAGFSLFALILLSLKFVNADAKTPEGLLLAVLLIFNPIIGFTGGGAIAPADLAGTAVAIGILALTIRNDNAPEGDLLTGILFGGILLGLAPSFVPLIILPLLIAFGRSRRKGVALLLFMTGIAVWLVPTVVRTGPDAWLETAGNNVLAYLSGLSDASHGFPGIEGKRTTFLQNLLIEGLGGYRTGTNIPAMLVLTGFAICFARGAWWMFHRETDGLVITVACISIYIAWLIFNPNDIREARHILPLMPLLLFPIWGGNAQLMRGSLPARLTAIGFLAVYVLVGIGTGR